jgi:predicted ferric reductase
VSVALDRAVERSLLGALYGVVLIAPIAVIAQVMKAGAQGPLVVFADALGFAALSLLVLQIIVSGRWPATTRAFGLRPVLSLHRQAGVAVLVLVLAHVAILMLDDPSRLALFDPRTSPGRARAGTLATLGLLVMAGTSIWRRRLALSYERWRAIHLWGTALVVAAAFAHVMLVDAFTSVPVVRETVLALVLVAAIALFWTRVARPYATAVRTYRVRTLTRERGNAVTVELEPAGHAGLRFQPGQFAWVRAADCLYGMDDHPFSLSSSAGHPDRPSFTVKALGDFSGSLADLLPGTTVLVDGPHGEAVHDAGGGGRLLVAAGIGITPALSVLRTAAERGERRPLLLVYGSRRWEDITFREELAELERRLPSLRVVHVLSRPDANWEGERGRVGEGLLRRHAPAEVARWRALICGPAAMVAECASVLRRLGVPPAAIQAEGFE